MSKNRDPNAPIALSVVERNELMADEELVQLREAKAKVRAHFSLRSHLPPGFSFSSLSIARPPST
jgi:hypothetical protein